MSTNRLLVGPGPRAHLHFWTPPRAVAHLRIMRTYALRLVPGDDLKRALLDFCATRELPNAFIITAVGSLRAAKLRLANHTSLLSGSTNAVLDLPNQRFEICSLVGTISRNGEGCHVHASLADARGDVVGGHALDGCVVFTTCEIVLGCAYDVTFTRELDPRTGFDELVVGERASDDEGEEPRLSGKKARRLRQMLAVDEERERRAVAGEPIYDAPRGILGFFANLVAPPPTPKKSTKPVKEADEDEDA
jgi:uncharacterized protein